MDNRPDPADDWNMDEKGVAFSRFLNATVLAGVFVRVDVLVSAKPHKAHSTQVAMTAVESRKLGRDLIKLAGTWEAERARRL